VPVHIGRQFPRRAVQQLLRVRFAHLVQIGDDRVVTARIQLAQQLSDRLSQAGAAAA